MFSRYCVIRTDKEKELTVKHYTDINEYNEELHVMTSAFEIEKLAIHECRRVAKMCGGTSLV